MEKPITFEAFNKMEAEASHALTLLDALFRGFLDTEQASIEDLAFIGMSLCENGQVQIRKVNRDWQDGKYDGTDCTTQNEQKQQDTRLKLLKLTQQIPDDKLDMIVQHVSDLLEEDHSEEARERVGAAAFKRVMDDFEKARVAAQG